MNRLDFIRNKFYVKKVEFQFIPFTICNLRCKFCEEITKTIEYTPEVYDRAYEKITGILETISSDYLFDISIYGGEIFADRLPKESFDKMREFLRKIVAFCKNRDQRIIIELVTNLVHHNIEEVKKIHEEFSDCLIITASMNVVGMFTKKSQISLFKKNMDDLMDNDIPLYFDIVAHKPNINAIMNDIDDPVMELFKYAYDRGCHMDFEPYIDVRGLSEFSITNDDYAEFMKFLYLHYPKSLNVSHYKNCISDIDTTTEGLGIYEYRIFGFGEVEDTNSYEQMSKMFSSKKCLCCEFNNVCKPRFGVTINGESDCTDYKVIKFIKNASIGNSNLLV